MSTLHFTKDSHDFEVWLCTEACMAGEDPQDGTHDGIVIGVGRTRDEALASAENDLRVALSELFGNGMAPRGKPI